MIAELMPRMEGELSSVLGVLATGRNQGRLEGFTINMTSLDDIFLEVRNLTLFDSIHSLKICFQVTSGGETRRLGTGETGPALAEGGDQVSHYHVKGGGGQW